MTVADSTVSWSPVGIQERMVPTWARLRSLAVEHPQMADGLLVAALLPICLVWQPRSGMYGVAELTIQAFLLVPLVWRRRAPSLVFASVALVAFVQWVVGQPSFADVSLLVALYT